MMTTPCGLPGADSAIDSAHERGAQLASTKDLTRRRNRGAAAKETKPKNPLLTATRNSATNKPNHCYVLSLCASVLISANQCASFHSVVGHWASALPLESKIESRSLSHGRYSCNELSGHVDDG